MQGALEQSHTTRLLSRNCLPERGVDDISRAGYSTEAQADCGWNWVQLDSKRWSLVVDLWPVLLERFEPTGYILIHSTGFLQTVAACAVRKKTFNLSHG